MGRQNAEKKHPVGEGANKEKNAEEGQQAAKEGQGLIGKKTKRRSMTRARETRCARIATQTDTKQA